MNLAFAILAVTAAMIAVTACSRAEPRYKAGDLVRFKLAFGSVVQVVDPHCTIDGCSYTVRMPDGRVHTMLEFELEPLK